MYHGHYQAVYLDISLAIEAAKKCTHKRYMLYFEHYGATCCQCGLTESNGIHPRWFRVKWKKLLEVGR